MVLEFSKRGNSEKLEISVNSQTEIQSENLFFFLSGGRVVLSERRPSLGPKFVKGHFRVSSSLSSGIL